LQSIQFIEGFNFTAFNNDAKTIAACVFNLSQIGELAGKLSDDFIEQDTLIPWRKLKYMRNRIVHDYEGVRLNIIWDILSAFLPQLVIDIDKIFLLNQNNENPTENF
jgi:uncharacterized protein with HEPN domain